jgi:toxin ParE1/3/4
MKRGRRERPAELATRVVFSEGAQADLDSLFEWLVNRAGEAIALGYVERIRRHCLALVPFPRRGTKRDEIAPGLRTIGFERRVTIAFAVEHDAVVILAIAYGGRQLDADRLRRGHR